MDLTQPRAKFDSAFVNYNCKLTSQAYRLPSPWVKTHRNSQFNQGSQFKSRIVTRIVQSCKTQFRIESTQSSQDAKCSTTCKFCRTGIVIANRICDCKGWNSDCKCACFMSNLQTGKSACWLRSSWQWKNSNAPLRMPYFKCTQNMAQHTLYHWHAPAATHPVYLPRRTPHP